MGNSGTRNGLKVVLIVAFVACILPAGANAQFSTKGICDGVGASVVINSLSHSSGVLSASGDWSVSGNADGMWFDYYIDTTKYQSESKSGTEGSWTFQDDYNSACTHTFKVTACPMVGATICWAHCYSDSENFRVGPVMAAITSCTWEPDCEWGLIISGTCTANYGSPYCPSDEPYWAVGDSSFEKGVWSDQVIIRCEMGKSVKFKAKDSLTGKWSNVDQWPCCAD